MDKFIKFVVVFSLPFLFACSDNGTSSDNGGASSGLFGGAFDALNVAEVDTATQTMRYYYTAGCRSVDSSFVWSDSLTGSELIAYKISMDTLFWQYIPYIGASLDDEWYVMLGNGTSIYGTWSDTGCEIDSGTVVCEDMEGDKRYWKIESGLLTRTWEFPDTLDAFRLAVRDVMIALYGADIFEDDEQDTLDHLHFSMTPASKTTGTFTVQDSVYSLRVSEWRAEKGPGPLMNIKYSVGFGSKSCDYENSTYKITQSKCSAEYQSYYTVYDSGNISSEMDIGNQAEFNNCLASMIGRPLFETVSRYFPKSLSRARGL